MVDKTERERRMKARKMTTLRIVIENCITNRAHYRHVVLVHGSCTYRKTRNIRRQITDSVEEGREYSVHTQRISPNSLQIIPPKRRIRMRHVHHESIVDDVKLKPYRSQVLDELHLIVPIIDEVLVEGRCGGQIR